MPETSPFMSAATTGTPAAESCSASSCSVRVFPVPVAPAIRPCRFDVASGRRTVASETSLPSWTPLPSSSDSPSNSYASAIVFGKSATAGGSYLPQPHAAEPTRRRLSGDPDPDRAPTVPHRDRRNRLDRRPARGTAEAGARAFAGGVAGGARLADRPGLREGAGARSRRLPPGAGGTGAARPPGGCDVSAPRLPRQPRHRQDDGRTPARADVPRDGPAPARSSRRGRPSRARRPVRRPDRDQDRAGDPAGTRRRSLHRRGLRPLDLRGPTGLRARGDRDAAQADGGLPAPPGRHRRRLPKADEPLPRFEPGPTVAVRPRDHVPGLLDRRARPDHRQVPGRERVSPFGRRRGHAAADPGEPAAWRGFRQRPLREDALRASPQRTGAAPGARPGRRARVARTRRADDTTSRGSVGRGASYRRRAGGSAGAKVVLAPLAARSARCLSRQRPRRVRSRIRTREIVASTG